VGKELSTVPKRGWWQIMEFDARNWERGERYADPPEDWRDGEKGRRGSGVEDLDSCRRYVGELEKAPRWRESVHGASSWEILPSEFFKAREAVGFF
jgi:hypothetical protein